MREMAAGRWAARGCGLRTSLSLWEGSGRPGRQGWVWPPCSRGHVLEGCAGSLRLSQVSRQACPGRLGISAGIRPQPPHVTRLPGPGVATLIPLAGTLDTPPETQHVSQGRGCSGGTCASTARAPPWVQLPLLLPPQQCGNAPICCTCACRLPHSAAAREPCFTEEKQAQRSENTCLRPPSF